MKFFKYIAIIIIGLQVIACSNDDGGGGTDNEITPEKVNLIFPDNGEVCTTGVFIENSTDSNVVFRWSLAENATSYEVTLTNTSVTPNTTESTTFTTNEGQITLKQDTNYSWTVTSIRGTKTTVSDTWTFYNAAQGATNHAPFPARLTMPADETVLTSLTGINLTWDASEDRDSGDVLEYTVYLGLDTNPIDVVATAISETNITLPTNLQAITKYYWKVITQDSFGNETESQIFSFTTP